MNVRNLIKIVCHDSDKLIAKINFKRKKQRFAIANNQKKYWQIVFHHFGTKIVHIWKKSSTVQTIWCFDSSMVFSYETLILIKTYITSSSASRLFPTVDCSLLVNPFKQRRPF